MVLRLCRFDCCGWLFWFGLIDLGGLVYLLIVWLSSCVMLVVFCVFPIGLGWFKLLMLVVLYVVYLFAVGCLIAQG